MFTKIPNSFLLCVLIVLTQIHQTEQSPVAIIGSAVELSGTLFGFAGNILGIHKLISGKDESEQRAQTVILEEIQTKLEEIFRSIHDLTLTVVIQEYYTFISDKYRSILQVLITLKEYEESGLESSRTAFLQKYESHKIEEKNIDLVYAVTDVTYAGGTIGTVPEAFAQYLRCDMTKLKVFSLSYLHLLKDALLLKIVYVNLTETFKDENELDAHMKTVAGGFRSEFDKCMFELFSKNVQDDVLEAPTSMVLHENSTRRYDWVCNDVYFYKGYIGTKYRGRFGAGTHFIVGQKHSFFYKLATVSDEINKLIIFGEKAVDLADIGSFGIGNGGFEGAESLCNLTVKKLRNRAIPFTAVFAIQMHVELKYEEGCLTSRRKLYATDSKGYEYRLHVYLASEESNITQLKYLELSLSSDILYIHFGMLFLSICMDSLIIGMMID